MKEDAREYGQQAVFGHPPGIFTLFFAEMWERFSYYGMRSLLVFYMLKGFLGYGDKDAYAVYGAYTALVYMTPFFGGMLADRLLGARRAVILGGLFMAAGHLMMTVENELAFFTALALLILGNGFFKPNISTIVGSLYPEGSPKRDGGFTIFYMGINLGAAMSPLLCGYIGETYGWHYGFGLATIGMLTGLAVFVAPSIVAQGSVAFVAVAAALNLYLLKFDASLAGRTSLGILALLVAVGCVCFIELRRGRAAWTPTTRTMAQLVIAVGALAAAYGLFTFLPKNPVSIGVNYFVGISLLVAAVVAVYALSRGGLPHEAGQAPDETRLYGLPLAFLSAEVAVYLGAVAIVPVVVLLVSGFAPIFGHPIVLVPEGLIHLLQNSSWSFLNVLGVVAEESSRPAGLILMLAGLVAIAYIVYEMLWLSRVARERLYVVLVLTFFSMLFWAFFEQAGSSVTNFTDRNVDRVNEARRLTADDVGTTILFRIPPDPDDEKLRELPLLSQEQLGYRNASPKMREQLERAIRLEEQSKNKLSAEAIDKQVEEVCKDNRLTITGLAYLRAMAARESASKEEKVLEWLVTEENVGMGIGYSEVPASVYQAANPIFILIFGLAFTALWGFLAARGWEPSTPTKFSLGLLQLGMGFAAFWYGAVTADERGMVAVGWLLLGYLLQTTGELCLSPVGLSMVTKLSPRQLVSTVMGMWFLATAFSQFLAAMIAQFTGVGEGEAGAVIPVPIETVGLYGGVFGKIAIAAMISAAVCFALSPLLTKWMHTEELGE